MMMGRVPVSSLTTSRTKSGTRLSVHSGSNGEKRRSSYLIVEMRNSVDVMLGIAFLALLYIVFAYSPDAES